MVNPNPTERARLIGLQDRIIELVVRQDEARRANNDAEAGEFTAEIGRLRRECDLILHSRGGH